MMQELHSRLRWGSGRLLSVLATSTLTLATGFAQQISDDDVAAATKFTEEYYKQITYSWTDDAGVEHTSNLAETARDYNQIVAMLREVYVNPLVPGFVKDPVGYGVDWTENRNDFSQVRYEPCLSPGNPYGMPEDMVVPTPVEGATALIVELADDYVYNSADTPEQMLRKIKEVTLLYNQLHIGPEHGSTNPGWLFNYVGQLDNFYIITKGNTRIPNNHPMGVAPFYNMYEEFSPSNKQPIYDAFNTMNSGEMFNVDHNCSSIMSQNHIIVMSPEDSPKEYPINFMFYLPDLRFTGDTRTNAAGSGPWEWYTYYDDAHQPFFFFNKIYAEINEKPVYDESAHTARVKVEWESTYKEVSQSKVPERFFIYRVVNDVIQPEPVSEYEIDPLLQNNMTKYDDGSMVSDVERCVIYVTEPQYDVSHDVHYIIKGRRYLSQFEFVESNIVTTHILGYAGLETLQINIEGNPVSVYDAATEQNHYSNKIYLTDTAVDEGQCLYRKQIVARNESANGQGTMFRLMRYTDNAADAVEIASMEVTAVNPKTWANGTAGVWVFDAAITYPERVDATGLDKTAQFKSLMHVGQSWLDGDEPVQALDGHEGILAKFADNFSVSTHTGSHANSYHYFVMYESAETLSDPNASHTALSNVVDVTVPIRNLKVGYMPYSEEEIIADSKHANRLEVNTPGVQFETRSNPYLVNYTIRNLTKEQDVVTVTRMPSGQLYIERALPSGQMQEYARILYGSWVNPAVELTYPTDEGDEYVLVLTYNNGNTYGNRIQRQRSLPEPYFHWYGLEQTESSDVAYSYRASTSWSSYNMGGTVEAPDESFALYGYRLWGLHDEAEEYELRYGFESDNLPHKAAHMLPSENEPQTHRHEFNGHEATEQTPVAYSHWVRLYAQMPESMRISEATGMPGYVVNDKAVTSILTDNSGVVTGIESAGAEQVQYRWFDISGREVQPAAMGSGVFIRVGSDGSTAKIIR